MTDQSFHNSIFSYLKNYIKDKNDEKLDHTLSTLAEAFNVNLNDLKDQIDLFTLYKDHAPKSIKVEDGLVEGSPEYNERLEKAKERFFAKYSSSTSSSSSVQTEEKKSSDPYAQLTKEQRAAQGEEFKNRGNELFRQQKNEEAIEEYTKSIQCDPTSATYYANRALAYQRVNKHKEAISDCKAALKCDPKFVKAYARLGHSYRTLGDYAAAKQAFKDGLVIDPKNESLLQAQEGVEKELSNASTVPDFSQFLGMMGGAPGGGGENAGPGGLNFMELLNNPQFVQMAQQMMQQNPDLVAWAQQAAQNPQNIQELLSGRLPEGLSPPPTPQGFNFPGFPGGNLPPGFPPGGAGGGSGIGSNE